MPVECIGLSSICRLIAVLYSVNYIVYLVPKCVVFYMTLLLFIHVFPAFLKVLLGLKSTMK